MQGGDIDQSAQNEIQCRTAWAKTFEEATTFFKEYSPFEFVYDPTLTVGKIDCAKETVKMPFEVKPIGTAGLKVIYDLPLFAFDSELLCLLFVVCVGAPLRGYELAAHDIAGK
jgi:hypothetical protein